MTRKLISILLILLIFSSAAHADVPVLDLRAHDADARFPSDAAVLTVATLPVDFASLAGRAPRALLDDLRGEAREALRRLPLWINALENEHDDAA